MRDLGESGETPAPRRVPKGLAFEIADLVLAQSWVGFRGSRMVVRLDHGAEDEEYEEVIELHTGRSLASRLIIWRQATAVFVQPLLGKRQRFGSVAEALDSLLPKQRPVLTDISASAWPAG